MSLFTIIRQFVLSVRGGDAHDSYGGNSEASDSDSTDECFAIRAAAQRAAEFERYPHAHTREDSKDVVLTFGQGDDWIRANDRDIVEVER